MAQKIIGQFAIEFANYPFADSQFADYPGLGDDVKST